MLPSYSLPLIFHGAVVLLFGLLLGGAYGRAISQGAAAHVVNSWRVAHASLPMGAILMLAVAMVLPALAPVAWLAWAVVISLVLSSYAFCVALPIAAITGQRGLSKGHGLGSLAYIGNIVGAGTSLVSAFGLMVLAFMALIR